MNEKGHFVTEQEIREGVQALADEMNFRLLLEIGEAELLSGRTLWVNNITVTDIVYPKRKKSIFVWMKDLLNRIIRWLKLFVCSVWLVH